MAKNTTTIQNIIINAYVDDFIEKYEISKNDAKDKHKIFEKYINNLIVALHGNDNEASFEHIETGTACAIDGLAIFVADKIVTSIDDVDYSLAKLKKIDVTFIFTQVKTTNTFERVIISDFLSAIRRFFNFDECTNPELEEKWEVAI